MARYSAFLQGAALSGGATKTVLQLTAGAQVQPRIVQATISFDGSTATAPVRVDMLRQTSAGSGGSSFTPLLWNPDDGAAVSTVLTGLTGEPTASDVLDTFLVPANNGLYVLQYPLLREPKIGKSGRIGWRVVTPASVTPNCTISVIWEET